MKTVKLTKLSNNTNRLRTNEVTGTCYKLPELGQPFVMFSEGIEFGTRMVSTSIVQEINDLIFKTLNSEYRLEILEDIHE